MCLSYITLDTDAVELHVIPLLLLKRWHAVQDHTLGKNYATVVKRGQKQIAFQLLKTRNSQLDVLPHTELGLGFGFLQTGPTFTPQLSCLCACPAWIFRLKGQFACRTTIITLCLVHV